MGRSSMSSLKQALFPLALLALISMVTSKPKHLLVETKGSGSSDDYSYPPPPPAYPPPKSVAPEPILNKVIKGYAPPQSYDYKTYPATKAYYPEPLLQGVVYRK